MERRSIFCCGCIVSVPARLTSGEEIYPHRPDLAHIPFWVCPNCGNYVGCHYKTSNRIRPLGVIPTPELRAARNRLHRFIDPIWKSGKIGRKKLYGMISDELGYEFHVAETRSVAEVDRIFNISVELRKLL